MRTTVSRQWTDDEVRLADAILSVLATHCIGQENATGAIVLARGVGLSIAREEWARSKAKVQDVAPLLARRCHERFPDLVPCNEPDGPGDYVYYLARADVPAEKRRALRLAIGRQNAAYTKLERTRDELAGLAESGSLAVHVLHHGADVALHLLDDSMVSAALHEAIAETDRDVHEAAQ